MHEGQHSISVDAVRRLVGDQFPAWAGHSIEPFASEGTTNAIFRIGPSLAARFPLCGDDPEDARAALEAEAEASRELSRHTSTRVPELAAIGRPGADYPLPWSIQTWLPGRTAAAAGNDPGASVAFARDLAQLIGELRAIDVAGRPFRGRGRGGDLRDHDEWMETCFAESADLLDVPCLRRMWARFRELPPHAANAMTHGDLIPGNLLASRGRLVGLLDLATYGAADPSLDLVVAWNLLDDGPRAALRSELRCTDLEWERGRAWAFAQAMGLVWYYVESSPAMSALGRRTLQQLSAPERGRH